MTQLKGVDISAYQSGPPKGLDFYLIKATQGIGYVDPDFPAWLAEVEKWGALAGLYHFSDMGDPIGEADYFLRHIRPYLKPGVTVWLDHEKSSGSASHDAWFANKFQNHLRAQLPGWTPGTYCDQAFALEGRCAGLGWTPLWLARYSAITSAGSGPWAKTTIQQYTDRPEDEDVYFGTRADWLALAGGTHPQPQEGDMATISASGAEGTKQVIKAGTSATVTLNKSYDDPHKLRHGNLVVAGAYRKLHATCQVSLSGLAVDDKVRVAWERTSADGKTRVDEPLSLPFVAAADGTVKAVLPWQMEVTSSMAVSLKVYNDSATKDLTVDGAVLELDFFQIA